MLRFERSYAERVTIYAGKVANLVKERTIDPGEYMEEQAYFWRRVLDDVGDWMAGREPGGMRGGAAVPLYRALLRRSEGTTSIAMRIPTMAFEGKRGRDPSVTLV